MKILTGNEAFAAMSAGQKIECRHAGSNLDFDEIRNFPATVFIDQDFEFRIAVIYMMIGSMQVPESITECPSKGTQCFLPSILTEVKAKGFKWKNSDADLSLLSRGLVHFFEENAITHANALIAVSRGSAAQPKTESLIDDLPWLDPVSDQNSTSNDVEEKTPLPAEETVAEPSISIELQVPAEDLEYKNLLNDLLNRAATATTPTEATALTSYTKSWSEAQRKPLLDAIHKRLNELNPPENAQVKEPPSLMVQIQNAKDLTELDCLEIEVSTRHADIQPKLMGCVKRRRFELENQGSEVAQ